MAYCSIFENLYLYNSSKDYVNAIKIKDYHDMVSYVLKELKEIYRGGNIEVNIDLQHGNGQINIQLLPVIQFIMSDC